ncbi:MAG: relaxase/mobilization nuclease domain-containing protein [Bacteroidales bacterium]|jgi:hypothetical protein|nr:relaxase/mobilization nuclease domain-containing protein [Bacteroidales bacterium]
MIGKGKSIAHTARAIEYARTKDNAIEIDRNMVIGETGKEIAHEFKIFQNFNSRCTKNTFSFVVSPTIEDGRNLTKKDFIQITREFLTELELQNHQSITYLHRDREHFHLHILCNRLNENGIAKKDNFIGKKAQRVAEKIALNKNLTTAKEVQMNKEEKLRAIVESAHRKILELKPKDITEYAELMKANQIILILKKDSKENLVGISFQIDNQYIKGSAVNKQLSAKNLQNTIINLNKPIKIQNSQGIRL